LWQPSKVARKGKAWLDPHFAAEIEREPFLATFTYKKKEFTVVNYHAITERLRPETEIKLFRQLPAKYPALTLVFAGDFNCPESHSVFGPLKKAGFAAVLVNVKTTLRRKCGEDCTASAFDNFFYPAARLKIIAKGAAAFHNAYPTLEAARQLSDHLPIWAVFDFR
jgi:endonuclease/exonuclease/phosphatase family metal-dependent hydrolase